MQRFGKDLFTPSDPATVNITNVKQPVRLLTAVLISDRIVLDPIHAEQERCHMGNRYGTLLQGKSLVATLAASLGVNGAIEIIVFLSKRCH